MYFYTSERQSVKTLFSAGIYSTCIGKTTKPINRVIYFKIIDSKNAGSTWREDKSKSKLNNGWDRTQTSVHWKQTEQQDGNYVDFITRSWT